MPLEPVYEQLATAKDLKERGSIKGAEIKRLLPVTGFTKATSDIEVIEVNPIIGGVEVFARAWKDGVQLGFGEDGSVDIERFKVYNPPFLVGDPQGDIIIPETIDKEFGLVNPERRLRHDPIEAIRQSLLHVVRVTGKANTNIISGKRGNTVSTFYSGSGDGSVYRSSTVWATARDTADGISAQYTDATRYIMADLDAGTYTVARGFFPFDTSALPDGDTISAATASFDNSASSGSCLAGIVQTSQASNTSLVVGDFDALTLNSAPEGTDSRVAMTSTGYKDMTLNATGIGWISKTGYTLFGIRLSNDLDNSAPSARNYVLMYMSEQTGTTNDPVLVVTHSAGGGGGTFVPQVSFIM